MNQHCVGVRKVSKADIRLAAFLKVYGELRAPGSRLIDPSPLMVFNIFLLQINIVSLCVHHSNRNNLFSIHVSIHCSSGSA